MLYRWRVNRFEGVRVSSGKSRRLLNQLLLQAHLSLKLLSKESVEGLLPPDIEDAARKCCAQNKIIVVSK